MMLCCGRSKETFSCDVELLDGRHLNFSKNQNIKLSTKCQVLFDSVCLHLNVVEKDYFGLKYYDNESLVHWLDPNKAFCDENWFDEVAYNPPYLLYFGVKFYAADPCAVKQEVTRYQFFLQLKQDLLSEKLLCSRRKAAEISALALQSEIGDYHAKEHKCGYVSEFRFLPNQDEKFESEVARLHATFKGLVPASAEMQYLRKCRQFDSYGVEMHGVKGEAGMQHTIGISPRGVETFKNKCRIAIYFWSRIEQLDYKDQYLKVQVKNKQGRLNTRSFELKSPLICKQVWKSVVEHHHFYRLPQNVPATTWSKRYSGRTEAEILQSETENDDAEVQRSTSKRYPPHMPDNDYDTEKENRDACDEKEEETDKRNGNTNWDNVLEKKGMFNMAGVDDNNCMTPKNERRERNRELQTLSDHENRNRKLRSQRGKSSGEESDSPSKRRIRARPRHRSNVGSDVSEISHIRRRRRKYHTDTEMGNGHTNTDNLKKRNNTSTPQSRRAKRLSKEDLTARQQLWQHIQRDVVDASDKSPEQLRDIPYTEVRTEGNPNPVKVRRSRRRHSSSKRTSGISTNSYTQALEDGMVSPLPITTTLLQEQQRTRGNRRRHRSANKTPGKYWDTKTNLSGDGSQASSRSRQRHKPRHSRNHTPDKHNNSGLTLVYSQI